MSTKEKLPLLKKGQVIAGRWEQNSYTILRHIGTGGCGSVYLAEDGSGSVRALKVSSDLFELTGEYRVLVFLRSCQELRSLKVVPEVYEIDDFFVDSTVYHFIVMEYCQGENLGRFKGRLKFNDAAKVSRKVAAFLDCLHQVGFIFGDLKPGNIIYNFGTEQVYIVDYGSVTVKGAKLKQFTPCYDRATWQAGTRTADEHYDMFSLGMVMATLVLGTIRPGRHVSPDKMAKEIAGLISNSDIRKAILEALNQNALSCIDVVSHLQELSCENGLMDNGYNKIKSIFANFMGLTSGVSFIMIIIYTYQFR